MMEAFFVAHFVALVSVRWGGGPVYFLSKVR